MSRLKSRRTTRPPRPAARSRANSPAQIRGDREAVSHDSVALSTSIPDTEATTDTGVATTPGAGTLTNAATTAEWEKSQEWQVVWLPVAHIEPNPFQPRLEFNEEEMQELVASVKAHGVLQPITVRTLPAPNFQLVAGERRLRACKAAGRKRIPAIVRDDLTDAGVAELALVENVQRARLNAIEAARGYKRLMLEFRLKEERIAKRMGLSVQSIKDAIRLLQLPDSVQTLIAARRLTPAHGQALLKLGQFPVICEWVAHYAADHQVTAKDLDADPLPNAPLLKQKGWIESLDWRTKFDWRTICATCAFGAYVSARGSGYCLKPMEWRVRNEAAIKLQNQEAACVMEEARQNESQTVEPDALPQVQYRSLAQGMPAGCTAACPCRRSMRDPDDPTKTIAICIDRLRHTELRQAERQAAEQRLEQHYDQLLQRAVQRLEEAAAANDWSKPVALLLRALLLDSHPYHAGPDSWELAVPLSRKLGITLDWDELRDPETGLLEELALLGQSEPQALLLLGASLLLALDAHVAVRFHEPAHLLGYVLGESCEAQSELEGLNTAGQVSRETALAVSSTFEPAPGLAEDEFSEEALSDDEALIAAHEAEVAWLEAQREQDQHAQHEAVEDKDVDDAATREERAPARTQCQSAESAIAAV